MKLTQGELFSILKSERILRVIQQLLKMLRNSFNTLFCFYFWKGGGSILLRLFTKVKRFPTAKKKKKFREIFGKFKFIRKDIEKFKTIFV